jgi:hypothetical protein
MKDQLVSAFPGTESLVKILKKRANNEPMEMINV